MSMNSTDEQMYDRAIIEAELSRLVRSIRKSNHGLLDRAKQIGDALYRLKIACKKTRDFGIACRDKLNLGCTQCSEYMVISRNAHLLPEAIEWGAALGMPKDTVSEIVRLLRKYEKKDVSPALKKKRRTMDAGNEPLIDDSEKRRAAGAYAIWVRRSTLEHEANAAAFILFKFAFKHEVSVQRYLAILGLEVPSHRKPTSVPRSLAAA